MTQPAPRTPLTVKIVFAQLALAAVALAWAPAQTLVRSSRGEVARAANADVAATDANETDALPSDPVLRGEKLFAQTCAACHQPDGRGLPGAFPPLAGSDFLLADADRAVRVVTRGLSGPVTVNGVEYRSAMPPMPLNDQDVAAVLSYVMQAWGNRGPAVAIADVARVRAESETAAAQ
ncbi:MAG TPA: cytochrome c [Opitutaceae bacterium]